MQSIEQFYEDFLAVVPLQLLELLDKRKMEKPVRYEDYALLTFQLSIPFTIIRLSDEGNTLYEDYPYSRPSPYLVGD